MSTDQSFYFCVYSPKEYDHDTFKLFLNRFVVDHAISYLYTHEFGESGQHHHVNFLYQSSSKDAWNEKRRYTRINKSWIEPAFKVKKVKSNAVYQRLTTSDIDIKL